MSNILILINTYSNTALNVFKRMSEHCLFSPFNPWNIDIVVRACSKNLICNAILVFSQTLPHPTYWNYSKIKKVKTHSCKIIFYVCFYVHFKSAITYHKNNKRIILLKVYIYNLTYRLLKILSQKYVIGIHLKFKFYSGVT